MRTDKDIAFQLRKQGKSYRQICDELHVASSTLSNWFKGHSFSADIRKELLKSAQEASTIRLNQWNKVRGDTLKAMYEQAEIEALSEFQKFQDNPLFLTALATYWGEGDKNTKNQVRLTNTDPLMLKVFVKFLIDICKIQKEKIRVALFIYPDLDEPICHDYWSKYLELNNFHKTMVLPSRHKTRRLAYGTCTVIVSSTYLKRKIKVWIDHLPKIILNKALK